MKLARLREQRAEAVRRAQTAQASEQRRHHQHERRGPVLDVPQQVHAAVDDEDVQRPRTAGTRATRSWCGRRSRRRAASASPGRRLVKSVWSASPPIQAWMPNQPQATSARISAGTFEPSVPYAARAKTGNGMPYFVPGCELSRIGTQHDHVAEQDRDQRLPPVHARRRSGPTPACRWGCSAPC